MRITKALAVGLLIFALVSAHAASVVVQKDLTAGGTLEVTGSKPIWVQLDQKVPEMLVYAPTGVVRFTVPPATDRRAYPQGAFEGTSHTLTSRPASITDLSRYRNLALNPYDVRGESTFYPHATSNSECRNESVFCARNAIDGSSTNTGHGNWPYQSWGPDQRTDLWWKLEFGRKVVLDKLVVYIRADFPHDKCWHSATIVFSDGSREAIALGKTAAALTFKFKARTVDSLTITDLVQDEPLGWAALTEVEAWGRDAAPAKPAPMKKGPPVKKTPLKKK